MKWTTTLLRVKIIRVSIETILKIKSLTNIFFLTFIKIQYEIIKVIYFFRINRFSYYKT